jgi:para-aminobenzoate synthetase/4-amino-4-deoxychorismate lyase
MRPGEGRTEGLIETVRANEGRIPFLDQHVARLQRGVAALRMTPANVDVAHLLTAAAGLADCVVRLELRDGAAEVMTRSITTVRPPRIIVSDEVHDRYPHKTTNREVFGRAFAEARRQGADDALLLGPSGHVTEGTAWSVFWWQDGHLCTPALSLSILPGIGRARVMSLMRVEEVRARPQALAGKSLFLVNAVRGVVEIAAFQGETVPRDARTAELTSGFWPD